MVAMEADEAYFAFNEEPSEEWASPTTTPTIRVYLVCLGSFCCSFMVGGASLLAPFLAKSDVGLAIGPTALGCIFAAFPLATALGTPLLPWALERLGSRYTVSVGLCLLSLSSLAFGLLPLPLFEELGEGPARVGYALSWQLVLARIVGGVGAALCEAGCLTTISGMGWGDHLGKALAGVELATGSGAALGAAIGGWAYQEGSALFGEVQYSGLSDSAASFVAPLLVGSALPLCLLPAVLLTLPTKPADPPKEEAVEHAPLGRHVTYSRVSVAFSLLCAGAACEGLNPILAPHFMRPPHQLDVEQAGLLISLIAFTYMLVALPLGWLVDQLNFGQRAGRRLKAVQVCGWAVTLLAASLLGPARPLLATAHLSPSIELLAFPLIGIACALKIIPSLPDMQRGLEEDDERGRAAICATWNGVYCLGSATGPLASVLMYDGIGWEKTICVLVTVCVVSAALLSTATVFAD
ncbi:hypothetical protein AB1Y20_019043 [Prymnesium parvum]|uniref:Major facilitator superfamily (MFS) profile domain-containing protein n=1 Tax=Prymnesium parvum TaxID=97485 RepID=A0AB34JR53_PRYPA